MEPGSRLATAEDSCRPFPARTPGHPGANAERCRVPRAGERAPGEYGVRLPGWVNYESVAYNFRSHQEVDPTGAYRCARPGCQHTRRKSLLPHTAMSLRRLEALGGGHREEVGRSPK